MLKRLALGIAVCSVAATTMAASLEKLGQPCRAFNILSGRVVKDPSGHEWLAMMNMNENSGAELLMVDFASNHGSLYRAPAGAGAWALIKIPDSNQLIAGTFYDGSFMSFDLGKMAWGKSARAGNQQYIWTASLGSDGRVYGGTYPDGHLAALDLKTFQVEDIPRPAKAAPDLYLRETSATPDGRILCQWATQKIITMLYDPKTKAFSPVPKSLAGIQIGVSWNGYFIGGGTWDGKSSPQPLAFQGPDFQKVDPLPFPSPTGDSPWTVDTYASTEKTLLIKQGDSIYRFNAGDKALELLSDKGFASGRVLGVTESGALLGIRGQDYVTLMPGSQHAVIQPIPIEKGPRATHFLRADDHGRLWGGPTFGQTVFYMDTKNGKTTNTSQVCNSGGEVYDAAFIGDNAYFVAYAGGDIIQFNPNQPWNQADNVNPRTIAHLTSRGYIRPIGGICAGEDGKLYSAWLTEYGKYGGAVSITDPASGKTDLIENPLGKQGVSGVAFGANAIYVATTMDGNGLPAQAGAAQFGVIDPQTKNILFQQKFDGVKTIDHLVFDQKTGKVAFAAAGQWYAYEPSSKNLMKLEVPPAQSRMLPGVRDGVIYYGSGADLVALDLSTGHATKIVTAPAKVETVAVNHAGELFLSCGTDVYRVKD
ncbi:MAG TPA: PQQ-binding-like beta-propeller repeat protein [Tepidisphaeraceae bacterium]|jgi:hypothetical protein|nr:PQQ-binding-like beta-propeller repeat protein [Tepidisphaeraceae bacterium]